MRSRSGAVRKAAAGASRVALAAAALCAVAGFVLWRLKPMVAAEEPHSSGIPGAVWVVHPGTLEVSYEFRGTVSAKKSEKMRPQFKSWAKISHLVEEGAPVSKGDVLARFDEADFRKRLADAERGIGRTEAEMRAAEADLCVLKASGPAEVEKARIALKMAEMDLERLQSGELPDTERRSRVAVEEAKTERDIAERKFSHIPGMIKEGFVTPERLREDGLALKKREMDLAEALGNLDMFLRYTSQTLLVQKTARVQAADSDFRTAGKRLENQIRNLEAKLLKSRAELGEFRKQEAEIREELGKLTMTAPSGGIVIYGDEEGRSSRRNIAVGQSVGMWHVLFTVLDMSALLVKIRVSETDIGNLKTGMPAEIHFDAAGLRGLKGKVSKVPEVTSRDDWRTDPNLKEFEVEVDVEGEHAGVKPGSSAVVFVTSARLDGVLRVPVHALRGENLDLFAYVLRQDGEKPSLEKSPVQVGLRGRRFAEIKSGLGAGDPVFLGEPPAEFLRAEEEAVAAVGKKKEGGGDEAAGGGLPGPGGGTPAPDKTEEED